ncbi:Peptidase A1 domain-containing protein [Mycena indigotica]|uniref:Peptidase A1 domain-containing protein n=1 Tax=Mycena indigotica TaxID=2126181 RepID=A0A8H6SEJ7_9AGAR|nr:Peptidase A1 domain-containing protein [Mycena indigotica]KAF7297281.1 Peptidase A1 domain-containing protein [Mycena indigotica]
MNAVHCLPFTTEFRAVKANTTLVEHDMARSKHLRAGANPHGPLALMEALRHGHPGQPDPKGVQHVSVLNAGVTYLASIGVGSPATTYNLLIDTGSSNTWISAVEKRFTPTKTTHDTRKKFQIGYGKGDCSGEEFIDQVTLGPNLVIPQQSIGVANRASDMNGMDGILGIGPTGLTRGTTADKAPVPTIMDNLVKDGTISQECIGIYYAPTTARPNELSGCLDIGGADSTKYTGKLDYMPITKQSPASNYWGLEESIIYDGEEIMAHCAGISDTGTTLVMLPSQSFSRYMEKTGAVMDETTGLLTVTDEQYANMKSMMFKINGVQYELTKNAQMWPRSMNSMLGGDMNKKYLVFANMGDINIGDGLCFINGYTMLQRFYSVYDTTNCQIGMATTKHTMDETN